MEQPENNRFLLPNLCELQVLFLLMIVMQLLVILEMLFLFGMRFDWLHFGLVTLYVQAQSLISASMLCTLRIPLAKVSMEMAVSSAFIVLLLIALVMALLVEHYWLSAIQVVSSDHAFVWRNVLVSAIISAVALRYLFVQQQLIAQQKSELQASLLALQARIRPHFLFNTLNSIASLITVAPEKAEQMIENLAGLIRASLREDVETTIEDEWQLCEAYLQIEKIRLDERLSWTCDFSGLNLQAEIPSLSLQPLLENAIYHGIQPNIEKGSITITGHSTDKEVQIQIKNSQNKDLQTPKKHEGHNMAVENIRHRLIRLYGDTATLELCDKGDSFIVTMTYAFND
ncbi:MAG: histidine kinase [Pseudomonadales bacterium]|nr:histidine kinase [Pseudomonadales bacterium]